MRQALIHSDDVPGQEYCNGNTKEAGHSHRQAARGLEFLGPFRVLELVLAPAEFFNFDVEPEFHPGTEGCQCSLAGGGRCRSDKRVRRGLALLFESGGIRSY